jgi:hypothetical protein
MELQQPLKREPAETNLRDLLFNKTHPVGADLRGYVICDQSHKKIGTIGEVYCDRLTLEPRYVEIIPLRGSPDKSVLYPYDYVAGNGKDEPLRIPSTLASILSFEEYDYYNVMECEGHDLVTLNETLVADWDEPFVGYEHAFCA